MAKILDAVSVVLVCEDSVFAIQRQNFLKSFPGYWAFSGGKVDPGDENVANRAGLDARLWGAVVREIREELAIDLVALEAAGEVLAVDELGVAITPDFNPYRFATYFFKITLKSRPPVTVDRGEAFIAEWFDPKELAARYDRGDMLVVPPVLKVFRTLAQNIQVTKIDDINLRAFSAEEVPQIESICGVRQFMPLSHTLPPANRTNCFLLGDKGHPQVIVDPSPQDEAEMEKLCFSLKDEKVSFIMLTHHHGDHHQFAPELARRWNVPIKLSADSQARILKKRPDYFDGIQLMNLVEGDVVTQWLGHPLRIVAVPGHDEGQLALMPDNKAWFLAGDLFQGIGTVVIGDDEGDMAKYMHTLEKVIKLAPRAVYPSHGIALGGTTILEKTLEHRKLREEQVRELTLKGKSEEEILDVIYSEIPAGLRKYALKNIYSHLRKLKQENKL